MGRRLVLTRQRSESSTYYQLVVHVNSNEPVTRVLLASYIEASPTCVKVRAIEAFLTPKNE